MIKKNCFHKGACCCKFVIFIKRKKSRRDRKFTDNYINQDILNPKYFMVNEDMDVDSNLVTSPNDEVKLNQLSSPSKAIIYKPKKCKCCGSCGSVLPHNAL